LLTALGGTSIFLENDIFFKLKPALTEIIFAGLTGLSAFGKRNLVYEMSLRYIRDVKIERSAGDRISKSLKGLFYVTLLHIGLAGYASFYMSDKAWAFISGGLFYIMILLYFGYEMIKFRKHRKLISAEEILPVIDEKGRVLGSAKRSVFHFNSEKKILHPVVHMHVFNLSGEIFLQKRLKTKEVQPDKWDIAVGGHVGYGESIEQALIREAHEEIGLTDFLPKFTGQYLWETEIEKEMVFTFHCVTNQVPQINEAEVSEGRFWSREELKRTTGKNIFTPNLEKEMVMLKDLRIFIF
jgi:isopentenyldiphosphate isomerase